MRKNMQSNIPCVAWDHCTPMLHMARFCGCRFFDRQTVQMRNVMRGRRRCRAGGQACMLTSQPSTPLRTVYHHPQQVQHAAQQGMQSTGPCMQFQIDSLALQQKETQSCRTMHIGSLHVPSTHHWHAVREVRAWPGPELTVELATFVTCSQSRHPARRFQVTSQLSGIIGLTSAGPDVRRYRIYRWPVAWRNACLTYQQMISHIHNAIDWAARNETELSKV